MTFDPTANWQSVLTLAAVISSWAIPFAIAALSRRHRRDVVRASVGLYLDTLRIKAGVAKNAFFQPGGRLPKGRNSFKPQTSRTSTHSNDLPPLRTFLRETVSFFSPLSKTISCPGLWRRKPTLMLSSRG